MSVMTFPAVVPNHCEYALSSQSRSFTSDLTGRTQTAALPIDLWSASMTFANRTGAEAHQLRAFLSSLRGVSGRFYCPMFDHRTPQGTASGTGKINGAGQTGTSLITDGWTPNQTGLLLPGDYVQVGTEVKMISAAIASDSGGNATLQFTAPLRTTPADNGDIITSNPVFVAMLADDKQARWPVQPGQIYALSIAVVEALDI